MSDEDRARIEVTRHRLATGHSYLTYRWVGAPSWPVAISGMLERHMGGVQVLPWPLKKVRDIEESDASLYVRTDGWLVFEAELSVVGDRIAALRAMLKTRIIATLAVWELAEWEPYQAPSWGDVYAMRRLKRWLGRSSLHRVLPPPPSQHLTSPPEPFSTERADPPSRGSQEQVEDG